MFFQLYVAKEKRRTIELVAMARKLGFKALFITVDTAVVGKREEDERCRAEQDHLAGRPDGALVQWKRRSESPGDDSPVLRGHSSSTLNWDDLPWIREAWGVDTGPVVLKGIQTVEDAVMAVQAGVDAIYLSNHGGRQCDDAPSSLHVLLEIHRFHPEILGKVEIYLDGWVRRGADILKAIALGASGVAIGRPFMYSLQYGTEGVLKAIQSEPELLLFS
jgi:L-lactate dehydrogenase (cytochrome)